MFFFDAAYHNKPLSNSDDTTKVRYEDGQALADVRGIPFVECSAKSNVNISEVFNTLFRYFDNGCCGIVAGS